MSEWKVYQLNDYEWWCAKSLEEAVQESMKQTGMEREEVYDESNGAEPLSEQSMKTMRFYDEDTKIHRSFERHLYLEEQKGINEPFMFATTEW